MTIARPGRTSDKRVHPRGEKKRGRRLTKKKPPKKNRGDGVNGKANDLAYEEKREQNLKANKHLQTKARKGRTRGDRRGKGIAVDRSACDRWWVKKKMANWETPFGNLGKVNLNPKGKASRLKTAVWGETRLTPSCRKTSKERAKTDGTRTGSGGQAGTCVVGQPRKKKPE